MIIIEMMMRSSSKSFACIICESCKQAGNNPHSQSPNIHNELDEQTQGIQSIYPEHIVFIHSFNKHTLTIPLQQSHMQTHFAHNPTKDVSSNTLIRIILHTTQAKPCHHHHQPDKDSLETYPHHVHVMFLLTVQKKERGNRPLWYTHSSKTEAFTQLFKFPFDEG